MSAPSVSVLIPTRDRAAWLAEALDSVGAQGIDQLEVVVGDDASRDATAEVVAARRDRRIRHLRHERPRGVAANRNACLAAASGRFVAWLDSDDRYLPGGLARQVERLSSLPSAAFVHGGFEPIDATGLRLPDWPAPFDRDVVEPGADALRELAAGNYVTAPTVVVRRSAHTVAGPYDESLASGEDWQIWMRLAQVGDVAYTAAKVAEYRWHRSSVARSAEASGARFDRELAVANGLFAEGSAIGKSARAGVAARALVSATECRSRGARSAAFARLLAARRAWPALAHGSRFLPLAAAALRPDDYPWHVRSRRALRSLAREMGDVRAGHRLRQRVSTPRSWRAALREIAFTVRTVTPEGAALVVADKWDPTLLHLARRRGWHFPDRRLLPEGYPRDSGAAVRHLAELVRRGAEYFVLPSSAFWWLDAYPGLRSHLAEHARRVWADEGCRVWRLSGATR